MSGKSENVLDLHPEILHKDGKPEFAVLPYEEYLALRERLDDLEDVLALRQARDENAAEPGIPLDDVLREFGVSREDD